MSPRMLAVLLFQIAFFASVSEESILGVRNKRSHSLSERLIMPGDENSSSSSGNALYATRTGSQGGRRQVTTTTLGPAMTFRGRAPPRTTPPTAATPEMITTPTRWYRRLESSLVTFGDRVGQLFGKGRTTSTSAPTTTQSYTFDDSDEEAAPRNRNMTLNDLDERVIIDAPSFNEADCPSGHRRSRSGRCRPVLM